MRSKPRDQRASVDRPVSVLVALFLLGVGLLVRLVLIAVSVAQGPQVREIFERKQGLDGSAVASAAAGERLGFFVETALVLLYCLFVALVALGLLYRRSAARTGLAICAAIGVFGLLEGRGNLLVVVPDLLVIGSAFLTWTPAARSYFNRSSS